MASGLELDDLQDPPPTQTTLWSAKDQYQELLNHLNAEKYKLLLEAPQLSLLYMFLGFTAECIKYSKEAENTQQCV